MRTTITDNAEIVVGSVVNLVLRLLTERPWGGFGERVEDRPMLPSPDHACAK